MPGGVAKALEEELGRLEETKAQGWLVVGLLIFVISIAAAFVIDSDILRPGITATIIIWGWFGFVLRSVRKRRQRWAHRVITSLIEIAAPWIMFAGQIEGAGAVVALQSWGVILFFCAIMFLTLLRLDARQALLYGVIGAVMYSAITFGVAVPQVPQQTFDAIDLQPTELFVRAACFLLAGVLCAFVSRGVRRAFGAAVRVARARDLFGKYKLEREIASGGMGTVWLATYAPEGGFRRPAAVKRMHPHLAKDEKLVDAFRKEAELGARLVHHNIVQTLDFGRIDDGFFLAMEYVEGCSCAELSRRAASMGIALSPRVVARIGRGVLAGLAYAHEEARDENAAPLRVVHRDLAPQNVLVSSAGLVKITDFGIARVLGDHTAALTKAVGHAGHVAPEHVDGKPIDQRSDIFLVGILLWELLCGRPLFVRGSDMATLTALLIEPHMKCASVDPKLAAWDPFLDKALAKAPADRYASASEMGAALERLIADGGAGVASAEELGGLVKSLEGKDVHDALTMPLGGKLGTPSDDVTAATASR